MRYLLLVILSISSLGLSAQTKNLPELIPYFENGKWGYCDKDMKIVIPCRYDAAYPFFEERALVSIYTNDTVGPYAISSFIDPSGKEVFRLNSSAVAHPASRFQDGVALVENYNLPEYGEFRTLSVVDKSGKVLQHIDSCGLDFELSMFNESGKPFNEYGFYVAPSGEYEQFMTFIYKDGRKPLHTPYIYIGKFQNGLALAMKLYEEGKDDSDIALINTKGEEVIAAGKIRFSIDYTGDVNSKEDLYPFMEGQKYGYVNSKGAQVLEAKYDQAMPFSEGLAVVGLTIDIDEYETPMYSYGYINTKGELLIPYQFNVAHAFREGLAEVIRNDSILFIDPSGKTVLSFNITVPANNPEYSIYAYGSHVYEHGFKNGRAIIYQNDKIGWINRKGDYIIPPLYMGLGRIGPSMMVQDFENGLTKVAPINSLSYTEFYIDEEGRPYFSPQTFLLPTDKKPVLRYAAPSKTQPLDTLGVSDIPAVKKYTGKKDKLNGKKGEWIEVDYWNGAAYVFSADFNVRAVRTIDFKGTAIYERPDDNIQPVFQLAPNSILFLDEKEKVSKVGKNQWVKLRFYGMLDEETYEYKQHTVYVKGDKIVLMPKEPK